MYCPNCGFENADNSRFCGRCGRPIVIPAQPQPTQPASQPPIPAHYPPVQPNWAGTPVGVPARPVNVAIEYNRYLGILLLVLFFLPWGLEVGFMNRATAGIYTFQFQYINVANLVLSDLVNGIRHNPGSYLLLYLLFFIPLAAFSLFGWRINRTVFPRLTIVFSVLGAAGIVFSQIGIIARVSELFPPYLEIFAWLCLACLIAVIVFSVISLFGNSIPAAPPKQKGGLDTLTTYLGYLLGVLFFLPMQIQVMSIQTYFVSMLDLGYGPFSAPGIIRRYIYFIQHDAPAAIMPIPIWQQLIWMFVSLFMLAMLISAAVAILNGFQTRKIYKLLLVFSLIGLAGCILRMHIVPFINVFMQIGHVPAIRMLFPKSLTVIYFTQVLILVYFTVFSAMRLKKPAG